MFLPTYIKLFLVRQPLASVSSTPGLLSHELLQPQRIQTRSSTLAKITKKYTFQKSLQVSQVGFILQVYFEWDCLNE